MANRNAVQRAFDTFGKIHFRVKKSGWWVRSANGVEQRLNLQKSQHARRYYVNFSLDLTAAVPEHLRYEESDRGQAFVIDERIDDFFSSHRPRPPSRAARYGRR